MLVQIRLHLSPSQHWTDSFVFNFFSFSMAKFITTKGISHHLEEIIKKAEHRITLVSPFLSVSSQLFARLRSADNRRVQIVVVYGKDELKPNQKQSLSELSNLLLIFCEDLHAKCFFNESEMVIGSMNMYEYSEKNNFEMGIHVTKRDDPGIFKEATDEVEHIIANGNPQPIAKPTKTYAPVAVTRGYCLRCEERIPYNPTRPYCLTCYSIWAQYSNVDYLENVCHRCGQYADSSMAKPECPPCFRLSKAGK